MIKITNFHCIFSTVNILTNLSDKHYFSLENNKTVDDHGT